VEKQEPKEKVVLQLEIPKEPSFKIPVTKELMVENRVEEKLLHPVQQETKPVAATKEEVAENTTPTEALDPMMPTLKTVEEEVMVEIVAAPVEMIEETKEEVKEEKIFFEISSSNDQMPTTQLDMSPVFNAAPQGQESPKNEAPKTAPVKNIAGTNQLPSSGSFLVKPTQIYVEEQQPVVPESNTKEDPLPQAVAVQEDEPEMVLHLVVKESPEAAKEIETESAQPIMKSKVEEPALQDETEELRRRANERLAKLRNLSFNVNAINN
jgi:cell division protein FtsZ